MIPSPRGEGGAKRRVKGAPFLLALLSCAHVTPAPPLVTIHAKRFAFTPATVTLKVGAPVVLELVADDREHGFEALDLGLEADVFPGKPVRLPLTPAKPGRFEFHCDVFCGSGHETMTGELVVEP